MKTKLLLIVWLIFPLLFACTSKEAQNKDNKYMYFISAKPESVGFSSNRLARLDTFLQQAVDRGDIPNAATFIVRKGKVVHYKAFGFRDIEKNIPLETTDIFRIASQSKAIISVALMTLYEEGRFWLDEPVSKYIPAFRNPTVLETFNPADSSYTVRPARSEITIRQLLNHTAGYPYDHPVYVKAGIPMLNSTDDITIEEVVNRLAALPLVHDPGEAFTYGLHTDIIGRLVEVLSSKSLDIYLKERIFDPLGMKDTYFYLPEEKKDRLVTLYEKPTIDSKLKVASSQLNQFFPVSGHKKYFSGGAGLVGTIEDYGRLCLMLLNGGEFNGQRILGRKTIEMMISNQIGNLAVWGSGNKFGLGFEIITEQGAAKIPGSVGSFKWGGAYATDYLIDPAEEMICLVYTNSMPNAFWQITHLYRPLIYQALED
ncbi:MAG: beta-lactamase family protein [Bacteroidales bacterium]|nr:beta-lactamase family protein [Bacteroidales bacterium]MBN2763368.1 beta-lactamase family protein [Bacteroidales bacterium]